jgi:phosphoribosylamine--glycine ligase
MRILVVGAGAREHALCWKFAQEAGVEVLCTPGNPGIGAVARLSDVPAENIDDLVALVARQRVDLTVVGPEAPLALGLADRLHADGRRVLGPTSAAARLETSKVFAKAFMARHGIPTARSLTCESPEEARRAVACFGLPAVIKADGLAAGKGVVVAADEQTAFDAIDAALVARAFGDAGSRLVIEEFLRGDEASFFVLCDGTRGVLMGTAQDHKRAFDGDLGPNTGGMGAFAPSVLIDDRDRDRIEREIVSPVLAGMAAEHAPFCGFLYVGLMITPDGPRVIEFNVRFGDPEAQVVIPSITEPLASRLLEAAERRLSTDPIARSRNAFVGVVMASGGYPGAFERGFPITGLDEVASMPDVLTFHGGTTTRDRGIVTNGGRVLTVVGRGADFPTATGRAYDAVGRIGFQNAHHRTDIGSKALHSSKI